MPHVAFEQVYNAPCLTARIWHVPVGHHLATGDESPLFRSCPGGRSSVPMDVRHRHARLCLEAVEELASYHTCPRSRSWTEASLCAMCAAVHITGVVGVLDTSQVSLNRLEAVIALSRDDVLVLLGIAVLPAEDRVLAPECADVAKDGLCLAAGVLTARVHDVLVLLGITVDATEDRMLLPKRVDGAK
eukprot:1688482-Prymnesium_polylepis.2